MRKSSWFSFSYIPKVLFASAISGMRNVFILITAVLGLAITVTSVFAQETIASTAEARLKEKNITLPPPPPPIGSYRRWVRTGNLLYLAGHGGGQKKGKVGSDVTVEEGYQAARLTGLLMLATTRDALGSLDKVTQVVKVIGFVNSAPGFGDQPKVINGFSELMIEVFGKEIGTGARSSIAIPEQGRGNPVEIEMILEVKD